MRSGWYVACVIIGTFFSWMALALVLALIDPQQASWVGMSYFYLALFLALAGTLFLFGYFLQATAAGRGAARQRAIGVATRQGVLFSLLLVCVLWLQANRLLSWLNVGLLVGLLTLIEFACISRKPTVPIEPR